MAMMTNYDACLGWMYGLRRFGIKLELTTIAGMLDAIGRPQERFRSIHIAGTNGKGSVAATLAGVLQAAGYRTGLYTSPHLVHFNERICIDAQPISNADVVNAFNAVHSVPAGEREPTFFEYSTAMALYEFARKQVNFAVIETGMGGRMDATNVISPHVCIITNISLEHRSYLGDSLAKIAGEKAGIIKNGRPVVTAVRQKAVRTVVESEARARSAPLYRFGGDFRVRRNSGGVFTYYGLDHTWRGLQTALVGGHQAENAALALAAAELLQRQGTAIDDDAVQRGLSATRWPGRLEIVANAPEVILDGAHNLGAARNLVRYLSAHLNGRRLTFVIGILDDKPYPAMLQTFLPVCQRVVLTRARIDRALPPETLEKDARSICPAVDIVPDVQNAVRHAVATSAPDDVICVAGSLYVVGEAKEYFDGIEAPPFSF